MKFLSVALLITLTISACQAQVADTLHIEEARADAVQPQEQSVDIQVLDATATLSVDNFVPDYFPAEGVLANEYDSEQIFVLVSLSVANTGTTQFAFNPAALSLQNSDAVAFERTPLIAELHRDDLLTQISIPLDDRISGTVVFSVPAQDADGQLELVYAGYVTAEQEFTLALQ